jgi:hypothetical protein
LPNSWRRTRCPKRSSATVSGSPALLLKNILERRGHRVFLYDPFIDDPSFDLSALGPMVFLIGVKHSVFRSYSFAPGSVIIDPWRYLRENISGVRMVSVGRERAAEVLDIARGQANVGVQPELSAEPAVDGRPLTAAYGS